MMELLKRTLWTSNKITFPQFIGIIFGFFALLAIISEHFFREIFSFYLSNDIFSSLYVIIFLTYCAVLEIWFSSTLWNKLWRKKKFIITEFSSSSNANLALRSKFSMDFIRGYPTRKRYQICLVKNRNSIQFRYVFHSFSLKW